jgi:5-formyltetrahydrofolate cyclo-ligase
VHPLQLQDGDLPVTDHDFFLDLIATPQELLRPRQGKRRQPRGVIPEHLTTEIRRDVPVLADLDSG